MLEKDKRKEWLLSIVILMVPQFSGTFIVIVGNFCLLNMKNIGNSNRN